MHDLVRLILMLGIAASAATLLGSAIAWWMDETRRMTRIATNVLGGAPDGVIVAQGRGAAAAFRLEVGRVLVMRDGGAHALLYPISLLLGAEMLVDEQVVARVAEGEPRRLLDRIPTSARHVSLRLMFDDPRHPDFSLDLWLPADEGRKHARAAPLVIQEARAWLSRAEALLRRKAAPTQAAVVATPSPPPAPPTPEPPPWETPDDDDLNFEPDVEPDEALEIDGPHPDDPLLPTDMEEEPKGPVTPNQQLRLF